MLLQRLATGASGVKQARYGRRQAARHSCAHAQYIHNAYVCMCVAAVIPPRVLHFSAIHFYWVHKALISDF